MQVLTRVVAAVQVALVLPAALFLTAVLVGTGDAPQYGLARIAQRIVMWYSARMWTLWLLLLALPFVVLIAGCVTLRRSWNRHIELPQQGVRYVARAIGYYSDVRHMLGIGGWGSGIGDWEFVRASQVPNP